MVDHSSRVHGPGYGGSFKGTLAIVDSAGRP
jgi:hypothetical protein